MSFHSIVARVALGIVIPIVAMIFYAQFLPEGKTTDGEATGAIVVMVMAELIYIAVLLW